ncbi:hypothetical protein NMG60_11004296 [Bertholletia excelsa]
MSSRRARASNLGEDEINELVSKLQALLPHSSSRCTRREQMPPWKILEETCSYIKRLHREVDNLSERISQLLASTDATGDVDVADFVRSLLRQ